MSRIAPGPNYRTSAITAQIHDDEWYLSGGTGGSGSGRQPGFQVGLPRPLIGSVLDLDGHPQFEIVETDNESSDGSIIVTVSVGFANPAKTISSTSTIPLVSLSPQITTTGGSLTGGQNLYYAVTAVDASSAESGLSFTVKVKLPSATNTNEVTLLNLSFSASASGFHVYRGATPAQLVRIASNVAISAQFSDTGLTPSLIGPPDVNFDHANFYWRLELQPEEKVDLHSLNTVGNSTLGMLQGELAGSLVRVTKGLGAGQERTITANSLTTLTVAPKWDIQPDSTSYFAVSDPTWQFGASGNTSPVSFDVPNRAGSTVQISGRAANVRDDEVAYALSPLTRWRISGSGDASLDTDVPSAPLFILFPTGRGTVEVSIVVATNARSITAGTLTIAYWDEVTVAMPGMLGAAMPASGTTLNLSSPGTAAAGDLLQLGSEIALVTRVSNGGATYEVTRGSHGSVAVDHPAQTPVYDLSTKTFVLPFARDFFGSPASGSYANPIYIPDVRIAAAELFMTNSRGNSDVTRISLAGTRDNGIRTLSGGQLSIQVEGMLAIQTNVAPPILTDTDHSVRDVFAILGTPSSPSPLPQDGPPLLPIQLQITQNGQPYCGLTIPAGSTISNAVDGASLGPLRATNPIGLDITSLIQTSDLVPGSDLTVIIRL